MYILLYVNIRYNHMEKDYLGKTVDIRQIPSCGYGKMMKKKYKSLRRVYFSNFFLLIVIPIFLVFFCCDRNH